jgi:hypothetical protein
MKFGFDSLATTRKLPNLKLVLNTDSFNVLIPWKVYCCMFGDDINSHNVRVLHFSLVFFFSRLLTDEALRVL